MVQIVQLFVTYIQIVGLAGRERVMSAAHCEWERERRKRWSIAAREAFLLPEIIRSTTIFGVVLFSVEPERKDPIFTRKTGCHANARIFHPCRWPVRLSPSSPDEEREVLIVPKVFSRLTQLSSQQRRSKKVEGTFCFCVKLFNFSEKNGGRRGGSEGWKWGLLSGGCGCVSVFFAMSVVGWGIS